jgi:hypothetical protein
VCGGEDRVAECDEVGGDSLGRTDRPGGASKLAREKMKKKSKRQTKIISFKLKVK